MFTLNSRHGHSSASRSLKDILAFTYELGGGGSASDGDMDCTGASNLAQSKDGKDCCRTPTPYPSSRSLSGLLSRLTRSKRFGDRSKQIILPSGTAHRPYLGARRFQCLFTEESTIQLTVCHSCFRRTEVFRFARTSICHFYACEMGTRVSEMLPQPARDRTPARDTASSGSMREKCTNSGLDRQGWVITRRHYAECARQRDTGLVDGGKRARRCERENHDS